MNSLESSKALQEHAAQQPAGAAGFALETKFRTLVEQSLTGIYVIQADRFVYVNPKMADIFGYSEAELTSRPLVEFVHEADRGLVEENIRQRLAGTVESIRYSLRARRKDGTIIHLEAHGGRTEYMGRPAIMGTLLDVTERRQAEDRLRRAELKYRGIFENAVEGILQTTPDGRILTANPAFATMLGYESAEALLAASLSMSRDVYVNPQDRVNYLQRMEDLDVCNDFRCPIKRKDGRVIWVAFNARPVRDAAGKILLYDATCTDITERKKTEEVLHLSEMRFATAFRSNPAAMCITTVRDGRFIEVNERYCLLFGLSREELVGRSSVKLKLWADPDSRTFAVEQLRANGFIRDYQTRFRRSNGEVITALISMELIVFPGEPEPVIISMFTDITERLKAGERIREQAALLDLTADAVIVRELSLRVTYWNKGAEALYGWTAAEAVGRMVTDLYAIPWEGYEAAAQQVLTQGTWQGETQQRTRAGRNIICHSRWTLLRNAEGTPQAVLVVNTDITEKKELAERLLRSQRMEAIGSLAGGIAHDLNNALAPILMASEFLKMTSPDAQNARYFDTIYESAKRGAGMVRQILTFARGNERERSLVQPKHLMKEMIDIARHTFPKSIQIRTHLAAETWTLLGNPTQLHQVLLNLCVNAKDAMPNGGTLSLATENVRLDAACTRLSPGARPGPHVNLSVSDTGDGMTPEVLAKIFDAFFTTKEPGKGTGLGLATVHGIVKDHGGFITVDSTPGKGTEFKVYLPAQDTAAAGAGEATAPTLPMGKGELILVVDDEAAIRNIATQTLQTFGYRAVSAQNGAHGVAVCAQQLSEMQLLITDLSMPHMDGRATIQAIRALAPQLKVIVASGSDSASRAVPVADLNVQGYLQKPYSAEELIRTVDNVLSLPDL